MVKKFGDIIGQEQIRAYLQRSLRDGRVSHALILDGAADSGREELAEVYASALVCEHPAEGENGMPEPCGSCISCIQAAAGSHADIIHVTHEKKSLGVDEIRAVRDDIAIMPYSAARKVYVIEDAEAMTPAAQNALLKTLEEPPAYAVLILLADGVTGFLPTVLSRCVVLRMKPVPEQQQLAYLRGRIESWNAEHPEEPMEASEEKLALCAGFSDGYPARAFALLRDPVFEEDRLGAASLLERLPEMTAAEISEAAKEYAGEKEERFAGLMRLWFRDVLVLKAAGEERRILFSDRRRALGAAAQSVSYEGARRIWEAQDLYEKRRRANVSGAAALELLLLQARAALRG